MFGKDGWLQPSGTPDIYKPLLKLKAMAALHTLLNAIMELESETHFEEEIPAFEILSSSMKKRWWILNQWCKTVAKGRSWFIVLL